MQPGRAGVETRIRPVCAFSGPAGRRRRGDRRVAFALGVPCGTRSSGRLGLDERVRVRGMVTGTVKWFNATKGYGFITPDEGDKDAFVHISEVQRCGMGRLNEGQRVTFTVRQEARGLKAVDLSPMD